jgi:predicted AlkP superfamily phosphohydrolase/phosphomutase
MGNYGQIYVNLKGREPRGGVNPGQEYEDVLEELTERLQGLVDQESGAPVIERVFRGQDVYRGQFLAGAPDLMFLTRDMEYKALGLSDFSSPRVLEPVYGCTGNHRMDGILAMQGRGVIREGATLEGAEIQDLAPTILYLLGVPVPRDMDGRVLGNVFTPGFASGRPVEYAAVEESASWLEERGYSSEEEEELTQRLRDLGYV